MGKKYLIDTNIIIYYLANQIPEKEVTKIEEIFRTSFNVSVITKIEFLGWNKHTVEGFKESKKFIDKANVIFINEIIMDKSIDLKRKKNIKLADSIISATSIINDFVLITRNEDDFKNLKKLEIYNPFK
jgi:predicted nucleic acid-binding protein